MPQKQLYLAISEVAAGSTRSDRATRAHARANPPAAAPAAVPSRRSTSSRRQRAKSSSRRGGSDSSKAPTRDAGAGTELVRLRKERQALQQQVERLKSQLQKAESAAAVSRKESEVAVARAEALEAELGKLRGDLATAAREYAITSAQQDRPQRARTRARTTRLQGEMQRGMAQQSQSHGARGPRGRTERRASNAPQTRMAAMHDYNVQLATLQGRSTNGELLTNEEQEFLAHHDQFEQQQRVKFRAGLRQQDDMLDRLGEARMHHTSALAYKQQGRLVEAEALLREAVEQRRAALGPNHTATRESEFELANVLHILQS